MPIHHNSTRDRIEFRSSDLQTKESLWTSWRGIPLLKQQNRWRTPLVRPQISLKKVSRTHRDRFDYSETHLPAHGAGKTTPKRVFAAKRSPGTTPCRASSRAPPAPLVHLLVPYVHPLHPGCTKVAPFWQLVGTTAASDTDLVNCAGQRKTAPTRKDIA